MLDPRWLYLITSISLNLLLSIGTLNRFGDLNLSFAGLLIRSLGSGTHRVGSWRFCGQNGLNRWLYGHN